MTEERRGREHFALTAGQKTLSNRSSAASYLDELDGERSWRGNCDRLVDLIRPEAA